MARLKLGDYRDMIQVFPRVLAAADAAGEEVESWPTPAPVQEHWAQIESPSGAEESDTPKQSKLFATIRFRHLVTVAAVDRLATKETGSVYAIVGVWRERSECGGWQTVCAVASILY